MVSTGAEYNFASVIDGFFALKKFESHHSATVQSLVRTRAITLLSHPDVRYMPAFKILDMLSSLVNIAAAVAGAPQLRAEEARILIRESIADSSPLVSHFMLEAALERARYQPMMLTLATTDAVHERQHILQQRWAAMRAAHQEKFALPEDWLEAVDAAVDAALAAPDFQNFRQGPLLQLFAEMLATARDLRQQQAPLALLQSQLHTSGILWKRYALKTERYREKIPFLPQHAFPPLPTSTRIH